MTKPHYIEKSVTSQNPVKSVIQTKEGYKQTEVGLIPEDWAIKSLGEIASINMGQSPSSKYYNSEGIGMPLLQGNADIKKRRSIQRIWTEQITKSCLNEDLIMTVRAPVGYVAIATIDSCIGRGVCSFNIKNVNKMFLYYLLFHYEDRWKILEQGSTFTAANSNQIHKFEIPLPPTLAEQTAIATALSDMDALIEMQEQLIAKKRLIKQGAMQELLTGKRRLVVTDSNGFKQTEVGLIPEDWEVKYLENIVDLLTGYPFPSSKYSSEGIRLLRGSNIKRGNTDWSDDITMYWPKITGNINKYVLQSGDVVIAMDGSLVGKSFAQLSEFDLPALLLQRVARLRTKHVDINYLKHHICNPFFTAYCDSVKTASAIPHISPSNIREFQIPIPPTLTEQTAIANALSDMDTEIDQLEVQLDKYRLVKQGMMQELLTGKIRLLS